MNITIAGAGVIGCAIAHELAARGARVRVVDSRGPGGGATRASAGILAPYIEGHDPAMLALGVRSLHDYDDFMHRVTSDARQDVEYERKGTLEIAVSLDEAMALRRRARTLTGSRVDHTLLDAGDVRRVEPAVTAEAQKRRLGGGSSTGAQRNMTNTPPAQQKAAPAQQQGQQKAAPGAQV